MNPGDRVSEQMRAKLRSRAGSAVTPVCLCRLRCPGSPNSLPHSIARAPRSVSGGSGPGVSLSRLRCPGSPVSLSRLPGFPLPGSPVCLSAPVPGLPGYFLPVSPVALSRAPLCVSRLRCPVSPVTLSPSPRLLSPGLPGVCLGSPPAARRSPRVGI